MHDPPAGRPPSHEVLSLPLYLPHKAQLRALRRCYVLVFIWIKLNFLSASFLSTNEGE